MMALLTERADLSAWDASVKRPHWVVGSAERECLDENL
jgi:hypothetical protein